MDAQLPVPTAPIVAIDATDTCNHALQILTDANVTAAPVYVKVGAVFGVVN